MSGARLPSIMPFRSSPFRDTSSCRQHHHIAEPLRRKRTEVLRCASTLGTVQLRSEEVSERAHLDNLTDDSALAGRALTSSDSRDEPPHAACIGTTRSTRCQLWTSSAGSMPPPIGHRPTLLMTPQSRHSCDHREKPTNPLASTTESASEQLATAPSFHNSSIRTSLQAWTGPPIRGDDSEEPGIPRALHAASTQAAHTPARSDRFRKAAIQVVSHANPPIPMSDALDTRRRPIATKRRRREGGRRKTRSIAIVS